MRGHVFRRYKEERKVIKRLTNNLRGGWYGYRDINNIFTQTPSLKDFIGTNYNFMYKNYTTSKHDSQHKSKFSSNNKNSYYRDGDTRERQKVLFLQILKENAIK